MLKILIVAALALTIFAVPARAALTSNGCGSNGLTINGIGPNGGGANGVAPNGSINGGGTNGVTKQGAGSSTGGLRVLSIELPAR